jgi:putative membrane protein
MSPADLPAVNALLNGLSAILLGVGFWQIRRGREGAHRRCMIAAFITSILFLACYLTYHTWRAVYLHAGPTVFKDPAWFRPIYLAILASHTLLAMVIVPLVLATLWLGLKDRREKHRRLARWTWPLWMYVSVTGVLIYLLLYRIFPQGA